MQIYKKASLKQYHTFSIDVSCEVLILVDTVDELISVYQSSEWADLPKLVVGKGSNLLFTDYFHGVVIVNRILGKTVSEDPENWLLHIMGGEDWPELVAWATENGYAGLENLALIPGCAGSAPIQNIGAYGVEFKDICDYVEVLSLQDFSLSRLTAEECQFGYRDSIFKQVLYGKVVITSVGLKLAKEWKAVVDYGSLRDIPEAELSALRVFTEVCRVRQSKLPDPDVLGNAGSFFKNPVVSAEKHAELKQQFPDIVAFPAGDGMKLAAGWLIDKCELKGQTIGGAQVHSEQALVLVNRENATAEDVIALADHVRSKVEQKYQVTLEHEVRFMGMQNETSLAEITGK
ncbi:UDP-N-acetylmuramate dehydrogenase [Vibrio sp. SCSIO 43137]|uniref:UDP-N-acetylmuramate dehydrogenase n=1 Tax=Vibrio sp. SCSIO 43137 TaxID=3021011 RepID=UPI002306FFC9|nr:UDP-N-acetylmuramate dehydrogenase [Vibrio sp. SCSIO 43137]WCE29586.1 UDP-N-acetylmuramate dehydrogenase [Vibrio sp. SCSIO 43137]